MKRTIEQTDLKIENIFKNAIPNIYEITPDENDAFESLTDGEQSWLSDCGDGSLFTIEKEVEKNAAIINVSFSGYLEIDRFGELHIDKFKYEISVITPSESFEHSRLFDV